MYLCTGIALGLLWQARSTCAHQNVMADLPVEQRLPLFLMVLLAPAIFLLGLPLVTGLFAASWFCNWTEFNRRMAVKSTAVGLVTFGVTLLYVEKIASVVSSKPTLLSFFFNGVIC